MTVRPTTFAAGITFAVGPCLVAANNYGSNSAFRMGRNLTRSGGIDMNKTCLFVALVVTTTLGSGHALAAPFPADATDSRGAVFGVPDMIATMPFLLGEVDLSTLGVADSELAGVGLAGATNNSPGDGPNMFIVDDDGAECPNAAFSRIQDAVNAAGPGDQVKVCPGTYQEQVRIPAGKDGLRLFSQVPLKAVIKAPLVMIQPNSIVLIQDARDVTIRQFTITGPYTFSGCAPPLDRHTGVRVINGSATLEGNHITEIRDANPALFGCQDGIGILVGRQFEGQIGTATIRNNQIDRYQKGGIVVDNTGSYALVTQNEISGEGLSNIIAQNGVQVGRGASADVDHNRISKNLFKRVGSSDTAAGVLLFETSAHVSTDHNDVFQNGVGIDIDENAVGLVIAHNNVHENMDNGVAAFTDSLQNQIAHNKAFNNTPVDCYDETVGTGTAGTANFWVHDMGATENRPGLCKSKP